MIKSATIAFVMTALLQTGCMQKEDSTAVLKENIMSNLAIDKAEFGIVYKNLQTGETVLLNEKEHFHAASTMKTPILIELFRQARAGQFSLTDSMVIKNSFRSIVDGSEYRLDSADDSELELYKNIGRKKTISSLAYEMIIRSSNLATNLLIELVKPVNVMATMKALGAKDTKVLRGVEDNKAFQKGLNNTTTAYDLALLLEKMANRKLVDSAASEQMIDVLLDQRFNEIIPALLPEDVKVAHKTGSITGVQHDSGIVFLPDGSKYILVMLSRFEPPDEKKVVEAMAEVSKIIYDHVTAQ